MTGLQYSIDVNAPAEAVWSAMLGDETYRDWTSVFGDGGFFEGSWDKGSTIRFVGPEEDGSLSGMIATVAESRPGEFVSLEYTGQIVSGEVDTTSDDAKEIIGSHENYSFTESDGVTTVTVDLSDDEFMRMFDELWPRALQRVKEIAETSVAGTSS